MSLYNDDLGRMVSIINAQASTIVMGMESVFSHAAVSKLELLMTGLQLTSFLILFANNPHQS